jgi:hypothetical protein
MGTGLAGESQPGRPGVPRGSELRPRRGHRVRQTWALQEGDASPNVDLTRALYENLKVADPELASEIAEQLTTPLPGSITIEPREMSRAVFRIRE